MNAIIEEGKIKGTVDSLTSNKLEIIYKQMKTCICKVFGENIGTGFFCKIIYKNERISVLITNYHIISDKFLENVKAIKISLKDEKIVDIINVNKYNKIYSSPNNKYDIMIIKIIKENGAYNYLELDEKLFNKNSEQLYEDKSIYVLHYPNNDISSVSFGYGLKQLDKYYIKHFCNTESCSSGGPILNLSTNKVIGIHRGCMKIQNEAKFNIGTLLKNPLDDIKEIINEIKIEVKIEDSWKLNEEIYFFGIGELEYIEFGSDEVIESVVKELNVSNTELFINNMKYPFRKHFRPIKKGIYSIKLKINISIKDCSHMFAGCTDIINLDLSSFDTKNVIDMSHMFDGCYNLNNLNISSFDTRNVTNMVSMFAECRNLKNIDLSLLNFESVNEISNFIGGMEFSNFDFPNLKTKNITDMSGMFSGCNLNNINFSTLNTQNATNMKNMFSSCKFKNINFSNFNTKNVTNMQSMFQNSDIVNLDLPFFDTENVTDMSFMFSYCYNLETIYFHSLNTKNVVNMEQMFSLCMNLKTINLSDFNFEKAINLSCMFNQCYNLTEVDLSSLSLNNAKTISIDGIFSSCNSLKKVIIKKESYNKLKEELNKNKLYINLKLK